MRGDSLTLFCLPVVTVEGDELHKAMQHEEHINSERQFPWPGDPSAQGGHRVRHGAQSRNVRRNYSLVQ